MANSPHPVLFRAMATELGDRGHEVVVTTRDHGQTLALTRATWPEAVAVGQESPPGRLAKAAAIGQRVRRLRRVVDGAGIDVAVSLNSYAQTLAARLDRIPSVTLMDYEYQPANHVSFRLATRILVPAAFPDRMLRTYGARRSRVSRFDGFKEELYLDSVPPPAAPEAGRPIRAVFRAPPEGSLYHRDANQAFDALIGEAAARDDVEVIVLPRLGHQRERYGAMAGVHVPETIVDGPALLADVDLFVGAGGTMSREAALLGIPAYTMFSGRLPAVDHALIRAGRLRDLRATATGDIEWRRRSDEEAAGGWTARQARAASLRRWFIDLVEIVATRGGRARIADYAEPVCNHPAP